MKKIMMLSALSLSIAITANAQKISAAKVPSTVKESFSKHYPGTVCGWEKEGSKFEAGFKKDGHTMSALFEANGNMTESEMDIKVSELPASVLAYVKVHFKGQKVKEAAIITKADGTKNYEAEVGGMDQLFDMNGKFLKAVKD